MSFIVILVKMYEKRNILFLVIYYYDIQIEKASIVDLNAFIDRFGFKLDSSLLSTGCKAALEVARCGEKEIIDLIECGMNARDCIISNCSNGSILISRPECRISDYTTDDFIDVSIYGNIYESVIRLFGGNLDVFY